MKDLNPTVKDSLTAQDHIRDATNMVAITAEAARQIEDALKSVHGLSGINMTKPLEIIQAAIAHENELFGNSEQLKQAGREPVALSRFLSDILTAAGLVRHGKQCKALADRLSDGVIKYVATNEPVKQESVAWIAVSDSLPTEIDGEVLVRMRDGRFGIAWATYWHGARNDFAQWTFPDPDEDETPTHWMRIPK